MKIGEIKAQALRLMYPDAPIRFDSEDGASVERAIYELKCNPSFEGLLEGTVGSINRALAIIEAKELSPAMCNDVSSSICDRLGDGRLLIRTSDDFLSAEALLFHKNGKTAVCSFQLLDGGVATEYKRGIFTLIYKTKLPRISSVTSDGFELILPRGVCELIPYFIKSELFSGENQSEARHCRELFEIGLERIYSRTRIPCFDCFETVYSQG